MAFKIDTKTLKIINNVFKEGEKIRNFCIMAHVDHGKTTLSDTLLTEAKLISEKSVTALDYNEDEAKRGITINSATVSYLYTSKKDSTTFVVNLVDSPGHSDFNAEVSKGLKAVDNALLVIDSAEGMKPQTVTVVKQALAENLKLGLVVNKLDKLIAKKGGDQAEIKKGLQENIFKVNKLIMSITGVSNYFSFSKENIILGSGKYKWGFSSQSLKLNNRGLTHIIQAVNKVDIDHASLARDMPLSTAVMELVLDYFDSPKESQNSKLKAMWKTRLIEQDFEVLTKDYPNLINCSKDGEFSGIVTFINFDKNLGTLVNFRVMSGTLKKGDMIYVNGKNGIKINKVNLAMGKDFIEVDEVPAGACGLIQGLKEVELGCTLSSKDNFPVFDNIKYTQEPVVTVTIKAKNGEEDSVLGEVIANLVKQNGTIQSEYDSTHFEYVLKGVGKLQLEVELDRIKNNNNIELIIGDLKLRYREMIESNGISASARSPRGHNDIILKVNVIEKEVADKLYAMSSVPTFKLKYAEASLKELGYDNDFIKSIWSIYDGNILRNNVKGKQYVDDIKEHAISALKQISNKGFLINSPIVGLDINLEDCDLHVDKMHRGPTEIIPTIKDCVKKSLADVEKLILEPVNRFSVICTYEYQENIQKELLKRRSIITNTEYNNDTFELIGMIPLRELTDLKDALLSASKGGAELSMESSGYSNTNKNIKSVILEEFLSRGENIK